MDEILAKITGVIPPQYQKLILASMILGRVLQAIRTGGGLKSILASIWLGTNQPKPPTANATNGTTGVSGSNIVPLLLLGAFLAGCTPCLTGCKSATPAKAAVNVSDTARVTVEHALSAWDDYIVRFHPPVSEQFKVKQAWSKYQSTQLVVLDAAIALKTTGSAGDGAKLNAAIADAGTAISDLINLIRSYGVKL